MPEYFQAWVKATRVLERERLKQKGEPQVFEGFGRHSVDDEDAWGQWMEHVLYVAEGAVDDVMPDDEND